MKKILLLFLFVMGYSFLFSQVNYPLKLRLNKDWEFLKGDLGNVWEGVRPIKPDGPETVPVWEQVSLPHCFNAEDAVDPYENYYEGPGWYRTYLDVRNPYENGRTILEFEGAGQKTKVYVYTTEAGSHIGGYDEWVCDITDPVKAFFSSPDAERFNGRIPLLIRCDNTRDTEMIPSDLSDFNIYGGIYRYLNLVYLPSVSISKMQIDSQVDNKGKQGIIDLKLGFLNSLKSTSYKLDIKILSPVGKIIAEKRYDAAGVSDLQFTVNKPDLWSPDTPNLYTCEVRLESGKDTTVWKDRFGFRSFEFVEKGPFMLNGKRLLLRGTHRHEDHAGVAAAMTEELMHLTEVLEKWKKRARILYTRHDEITHYSKDPGISRRLYNLVESKADAVIHLGNFSKEQFLYKHSFPEQQHHIIPRHIYDTRYSNRITKKEARKILNISEDKNIFLAFGNFRHREEKLLVYKAFEQLSIENKLLMAPSWYRSENIAEDDLISPDDKWYRVGKRIVTSNMLPYCFAAADVIFIQRTQILNSGNLPMGFFYNKTVAGPKLGNVEELLNNMNIFSINPLNNNSVINALEKAMERAKKGVLTNGRFAKENWNTNKIAELYKKVYQGV